MNNLKQKNLAFFFTKGMSLDKWDKSGILEREIEIYNRLARHFNKIYFFTYGDITDFKFKDYLAPNIQVVPNVRRTNENLYSLIIPIIHRNLISACDYLKTNQMRGAWSAFLGSCFKGKFILRTGFTWSLILKRNKKNPSICKTVRLIERIMYKCCDMAIISSKQDFIYITKNYTICSSKVRLIPNYVNTDIFKPMQMKKFENRILFVGRLEKEKNLLNLIKGLSDLNLALDFIGEGSLKSEIMKKAEAFNVKVKFLGIISNNELPMIMNRYKIFILPSYYEGMPKSLLEAMSCGLACIVTKVPGSTEVITDRKTGLIAETCYSDDIRKVILELQKNSELQRELGLNAHRFIKKNYSIKNIIKKELRIYKNLNNS